MKCAVDAQLIFVHVVATPVIPLKYAHRVNDFVYHEQHGMADRFGRAYGRTWKKNRISTMRCHTLNLTHIVV